MSQLLTIAVCVIVVISIVAAGRYLMPDRGPLTITFRSMDECAEVGFTALWALKQVDRDDPRFRTLLYLRTLLGRYPNAYFLRRMSRAELEMLAPFIDKVIEGKGPPQNLPAEYEDRRPSVLSNFKARMQAGGLWPAQPAAEG
jgi:hypothetical protein